ncbi:MAG: cbb3-type cytochrome oxidase assembly protein CcoS [Bacteroidetes bacterium]|nr:cbb3-type cytochrome oxidase assembly protein CcoS [Bacteroidota bacterium]
MSVIIILIAISLLVASGFLIAFLWAMKSGQYEDEVTPSIRMLFENEGTTEKKIETTENQNKDLC